MDALQGREVDNYISVNAMSGTPGPSNTGKAIASLAKIPADTTRAGTQKMKFVPTLPFRRKKEYVTSLLSSTVHTLLIPWLQGGKASQCV